MTNAEQEWHDRGLDSAVEPEGEDEPSIGEQLRARIDAMNEAQLISLWEMIQELDR